MTLNNSYLKTLSAGEHSLAIVFKTGTAAAQFTIKVAETTPSTPVSDSSSSSVASTPQTGDDSNLVLWAGLFAINTMILISLFAMHRKKQ
ncbi:MAG: LPXTG cell wall anchor domain-containing protein [Pygmaiobacter massiliensis]|nr:LPXTG cell wall anchor domain-containing protein [Pygmaiobacter massiliensis]